MMWPFNPKVARTQRISWIARGGWEMSSNYVGQVRILRVWITVKRGMDRMEAHTWISNLCIRVKDRET